MSSRKRHRRDSVHNNYDDEDDDDLLDRVRMQHEAIDCGGVDQGGGGDMSSSSRSSRRRRPMYDQFAQLGDSFLDVGQLHLNHLKVMFLPPHHRHHHPHPDDDEEEFMRRCAELDHDDDAAR